MGIIYILFQNIFTGGEDYRGQEEEEELLNPSEHSYELYLHADRSADQNDNKESDSMLTPSGDNDKIQNIANFDSGATLGPSSKYGKRLPPCVSLLYLKYFSWSKARGYLSSILSNSP